MGREHPFWSKRECELPSPLFAQYQRHLPQTLVLKQKNDNERKGNRPECFFVKRAMIITHSTKKSNFLLYVFKEFAQDTHASNQSELSDSVWHKYI